MEAEFASEDERSQWSQADLSARFSTPVRGAFDRFESQFQEGRLDTLTPPSNAEDRESYDRALLFAQVLIEELEKSKK